jgi:hypothetical protein
MYIFKDEKSIANFMTEQCAHLHSLNSARCYVYFTCIQCHKKGRRRAVFNSLSLDLDSRKSRPPSYSVARKSWLLFRPRSFVSLIDNFVEEGKSGNETEDPSLASGRAMHRSCRDKCRWVPSRLLDFTLTKWRMRIGTTRVIGIIRIIRDPRV